MRGAEGVDLGALRLSEVGDPVLGRADVAHEPVEAGSARPLRRAERTAAVPEPLGQTGAVRLDALRVEVSADPVVLRHLAHPLAREEAAQTLDAAVAVVLLPPTAVVHQIVDLLVVSRRVHAEARQQAAAREQVSGGEVLRQSEGILEADRDHRVAELHPLGVLRHRREERGRRGQPVLQVPRAHPAAVEPQLLREAEQLDRLLEAPCGIVALERYEVDEAEMTERARGHCGPLRESADTDGRIGCAGKTRKCEDIASSYISCCYRLCHAAGASRGAVMPTASAH